MPPVASLAPEAAKAATAQLLTASGVVLGPAVKAPGEASEVQADSAKAHLEREDLW